MAAGADDGAQQSPSAPDQPAEVLTLIADYLDQLAIDTHRRLGDVAGVAVTMADRSGQPVTIGSSTGLARSVDELQYEVGHGPCLNALHGGGGNYVPSLAQDARWGRYGPAAAALGARSCLSIPVESRDAVVAVFKVYSDVDDGLSPDQRRQGHEAAREAAGGIGLAQTLTSTSAELADRTSAMDTRRVIDLALGVLMERARCDADQAFRLLRSYSQTRNVKVQVVATELVAGVGAARDDPEGAEGSSGIRAPFKRRGQSPGR